MTRPLVISLGISGLTEANVSFRFYEDGVANTGTASSLTLTEIGSDGDYRVNNLPDATLNGPWLTVTWDYLGVYGWYVYHDDKGGVPSNLIVPVRESGLVVGDFDMALYKDGVLQGDSLSTVEVGSPGDYRVTGWPSDERGEWLLVWRYAGVSYSYSWEVLYVGATTYLQILSVQRPFPFGVDSSTPPRVQFSLNFEAVSQGAVTDWEQEIVQFLEDASLSTPGTDTFIGPLTPLPEGDGPYIRILDTGGSSPDVTHDGGVYENLSCQIVVTAKSYTAGRTRALAIRRELDGKYDVSIEAA